MCTIDVKIIRKKYANACLGQALGKCTNYMEHTKIPCNKCVPVSKTCLVCGLL